MNNKRAHLEMIQNIINRLSQGSFLLKGWSVLLISALFALAAGGAQPFFVYIAYFPAVAFWILDGYFLWQERLFRALFDYVRGLSENEVDFSMDTSVVRGQVDPWRDVVFSKTLVIFHGTLMASIVMVTLITLFADCLTKG